MKQGIDRTNLDPEISPAQDFYHYACGGWIKKNPLTDEFARFGAFDRLREDNRKRLKDLITNLSEDPQSRVKGSVAQKVADLYALGMDEARLNREGAAPLKPILERVESVNRGNLASSLGYLHGGTADGFFSSGVGPDTENTDINILHISEAGLGLGDRDYYLVDSEENRKILKAYRKYIHTLASLAGYDDAAATRTVESVIKIETKIASLKMTKENRRNPRLRYNPHTPGEAKGLMPRFDWDAYFAGLHIDFNKLEKVNVTNPAFFRGLEDLLGSITDVEIADYLRFNAISSATGALSDDFINADFEMYDVTMSGKKELEPRWKRAMGMATSMFGEAVGEIYVRKYFPPESKEYMKNLVENLREGLGIHISRLEWMSDETKKNALDKLASLKVKIGYPDKWKDYSEIDIDPAESYLENVHKASRWFVADNYSKLGKPVDKEEWFMTPQTVNAYYSPLSNEICFPAGILQPPFYSPDYDDSLNYGAIGVVIGHEMTHGFDDQGRQFDKNGNLKDWWKESDSEAFNALAAKLVKQFDETEVLPGLFANGKYTLGENIADQGGLNVALTAFSRHGSPESQETIDGFTPLQRFFISYAGVWANNIREEEMRRATVSDPHSLGINRVNVTLRNLEPFFSAFGIKEGDMMFRPEEERVIIW